MLITGGDTMKITIDGSAFYAIPNTHYCISTERVVYNTKRHKSLTKEGNTVKLTMNGQTKRYNCDKLLIDALLAHINEQDSEYYDTNMKLNSILDILNK